MLTKENYNAMADILISHAVGYITGLLDYFFRGRLKIIQAHNLANTLTITFKNVSATDT